MLITKSDFLTYLDAPCHLWAFKHDLVPTHERNAYLDHLSAQGYEVEKWALKYLADCLVPEYGAMPEDVLIQQTVTTEHFEARADILIRQHGSDVWDIYEIKSSTEVKKEHYYDVTFQTLVLEEQYKIGHVFVMHLNREYIRNGDVDCKQLFHIEDVSTAINKMKEEVRDLRADALYVAEQDSCEKFTGCWKPKECPCPDICHIDLPEYSIFDINNFTRSKKKVELLLTDGIRSIHDVPSEFALSDAQRLQVTVAKSGNPAIDLKTIKAELQALVYPLYFIDYETFNPAVPMYDRYGPFSHIPFQYSLHVQHEPNGNIEHYEFLHLDKTDPIPDFLRLLQEQLATSGSILVWNKTFEGGRNKDMGKMYPEFADFCDNMNSRHYDLALIFQKQWYAHPDFKGSYSIKKVLPVLVPELSYKEMEVGEGATAMATWKRLVSEEGMEDLERARLREAMLRYCEMDTFAMVKIWQHLQGLSS